MALTYFPYFGFMNFRRNMPKEAIREHSNKFYQVLTKDYKIIKYLNNYSQETESFLLSEWQNIFEKNLGHSIKKLPVPIFCLQTENFHQEWKINFNFTEHWFSYEAGVLNDSFWMVSSKPGEETASNDLIENLVSNDIADVVFNTVVDKTVRYPVEKLIGKTPCLYLWLKLSNIGYLTASEKNQQIRFSEFSNFLAFINRVFQYQDSKINTLSYYREFTGTSLSLDSKQEEEFLILSDKQLLSKITKTELDLHLTFLQISSHEWLEPMI